MRDDPHERPIIDDVNAYGWYGVQVEADDKGPGFEYTIGFMKTFGHPEVIIFGLDIKVMHDILWIMAAEIRHGSSFREAKEYAGLLENYACAIRPVLPDRHPEFLGYAMWYCRHTGDVGGLEAVQCIWPDVAGRFPWEPECDEAPRKRQPLLYLKTGR